MGAFSDFKSQRPYQVWPGVVARAINGERVTVALVDLDPGMPVAEHHHENEQLGFIIKGEMEMKIGDETRLLRAGDNYVIPSNLPHSVVKTGPEGAVVVDIFAPVRADWANLEQGEPSPGSWP
jgi:quercetin dioxygenase-like cupin family protein